MQTGNSGISDPELNCCRAEQETWQVFDEAELLCKCSNFTESMNFKRSFKGMFLNSFISSMIGMFLLDFQKNCLILWFYFVVVCFAVLWGLTGDFWAFGEAILDEEASHTYTNKANLQIEKQYI